MQSDDEIKEILGLFQHIITAYDEPKTVFVKGKKTLKFTVYLKDGSLMDVYNSLFLLNLKSRYSYQWMKADKTLIVCWDDADHHPQISTHPHHKHVGTRENILPSEEMDLAKTLSFIAKALLAIVLPLIVAWWYRNA